MKQQQAVELNGVRCNTHCWKAHDDDAGGGKNFGPRGGRTEPTLEEMSRAGGPPFSTVKGCSEYGNHLGYGDKDLHR